MFSVYLECRDDERDAVSAELNERGTLGIFESGSGLRAWFDDGADVGDLVERYDGHIVPEPDSDDDWIRRTQDSFPPIPIGERFWLAPEWNREPPPPGRMRLEITPGMACGTGWHECTQLCLEWLEGAVTPGCSVFDAGIGSGILSVAARMLGAACVVGCDIDIEAVEAARERLGGNLVYAGTPEAARSASFDIVVANISPTAIRELEPDLRRIAKPGAAIIVSGFPDYPLEAPPIRTERRGEWLVAQI